MLNLPDPSKRRIKMPQMVVLTMDTNGRLQKEIIDGTKVMVTTATVTIQNILSSSGSIIGYRSSRHPLVEMDNELLMIRVVYKTKL